jgi:hypothetical protein
MDNDNRSYTIVGDRIQSHHANCRGGDLGPQPNASIAAIKTTAHRGATIASASLGVPSRPERASTSEICCAHSSNRLKADWRRPKILVGEPMGLGRVEILAPPGDKSWTRK